MARSLIPPVVIVCVLLSVSTLAAADQPKRRTADRAKTAKAFVRLLAGGEFEKAAAGFDEAMLKAVPPDRLQQLWEAELDASGAFKKSLDTRTESHGVYELVHVTCEFARRRRDIRVVFNKEGKITGLYFAPAVSKGAEEIWEGSLKARFAELRLVFHLFKNKDGSYWGTMDSPDQGATGVALDEVRVKDSTVRLELKSAGMVVTGTLSKDGREIKGQVEQRGTKLPLSLKRVTKVKEVRRPQTPHEPFPYQEVDVTYENTKAGIKLAGSLTLPRARGPAPAVLLITGSGAQDRDETLFAHKPFAVLADYLTRRGIAVLRVDDRGVGGSTGSVPDATSEDFADDVQAGVAYLKTRKEIDPQRIGLIGHSEGGLIAALVASRSHDIAFIVMLAGPGLPGDQILYTQGRDLLKALGADARQIADEKEFQQRIFTIVRQEKDDAAAEKKLKAAFTDHASKRGKNEKQMEELRAEVEGHFSGLVTPWFRYFLDSDPRPALRKVTCPVLALNGEKDLQVDAKANLAAIAAALEEGGNKDVTTHEFPSLNHLFQSCKTGVIAEYGAIEETMAPVVLKTIGEWILQRTAPAATP